MNGIMQLSVCCLVFCAGCQATDGLTGWMHNGRDSQVNAGPQDPGGLPPARQTQHSTPSSQGFPDTVGKHVEIGQEAIASWYDDQQSHHLATARMHFEEALRIKPEHAEAHQGLGIVADLQQDYDEAELHYQRALAQTPHNSQILANLGYSYLLQNRLRESEQYLLRALQADPDHRNATKHLGDVYARQGKRDLAKETYRKVLSPDQAEQALAQNASNSPSVADEQSDSTLGSVLPAKGERQNNATQEIMQLMEQERREAEQKRHQTTREDPPPQFSRDVQPPPRMNPEGRLKQELAVIDREQHANLQPHGPILIDSRTGTTHRIPDIETDHPWAVGQPPHSAHDRSSGRSFAEQDSPTFAGHSPERHEHHPPGQPEWRVDSQRSATELEGLPGPSEFELAAGAPASRKTDDPLHKPWTGIQPPQPGPSPSPQPVDPAFHQQPSSQPIHQSSVPPELGGADRSRDRPPERPDPTGREPHARVAPSGANASFEEASKAAARMGMGLGPGMMFPVFGQSTSLRSAGSSSHWNGETFPAPHRVLPTDLPPPDLRRAFEPETGSMAPPENQQGQRMPDSRPPLYSQEQFGTASRYDEATLRGADIPPSSFSDPALRAYDQQRQRADQQLNQAMHHAWGQGAMNPVPPSGGDSPESSVGVPGGRATWDHQNHWSHPPAWPSGSGIQQASGSPASNDRTTSPSGREVHARYDGPTPPRGAWQDETPLPPHSGEPAGDRSQRSPSRHPPGVIVPPPYAASSGTSTPDQAGHSTGSRTPHTGDWPVIIPGNR